MGVLGSVRQMRRRRRPIERGCALLLRSPGIMHAERKGEGQHAQTESNDQAHKERGKVVGHLHNSRRQRGENREGHTHHAYLRGRQLPGAVRILIPFETPPSEEGAILRRLVRCSAESIAFLRAAYLSKGSAVAESTASKF